MHPRFTFTGRPQQGSDLGVTTEELGYTVDALIDGAYATDYYYQGDKIDLTIVGNEDYAGRTQDLAALVVATPSGDLARLEALADVELAGGPEQINRRERQRAITISVSPPPTMPLEAGHRRHQPRSDRAARGWRRIRRRVPCRSGRHGRQTSGNLAGPALEHPPGPARHLPAHGRLVRVLALPVCDHPQRPPRRRRRFPRTTTA